MSGDIDEDDLFLLSPEMRAKCKEITNADPQRWNSPPTSSRPDFERQARLSRKLQKFVEKQTKKKRSSLISMTSIDEAEEVDHHHDVDDDAEVQQHLDMEESPDENLELSFEELEAKLEAESLELSPQPSESLTPRMEMSQSSQQEADGEEPIRFRNAPKPVESEVEHPEEDEEPLPAPIPEPKTDMLLQQIFDDNDMNDVLFEALELELEREMETDEKAEAVEETSEVPLHASEEHDAKEAQLKLSTLSEETISSGSQSFHSLGESFGSDRSPAASPRTTQNEDETPKKPRKHVTINEVPQNEMTRSAYPTLVATQCSSGQSSPNSSAGLRKLSAQMEEMEMATGHTVAPTVSHTTSMLEISGTQTESGVRRSSLTTSVGGQSRISRLPRPTTRIPQPAPTPKRPASSRATSASRWAEPGASSASTPRRSPRLRAPSLQPTPLRTAPPHRWKS